MNTASASGIGLAMLLHVSAIVNATTKTISFNTGQTPWTVSAGGAVDVPPYNVNGNSGFSITSNGFSTGVPVQGLDINTFDGYWTAYFPFFLPSNATNVTLTYSSLNSDDRTVLELNGIPIGSAGNTPGPPAPGSMTLTDGGPNVPYQFAGHFTSGSVRAGFILGAPNLLEGIINNTGTGINGAPQDIGPTDGTDFGVQGTITYTFAPLPGDADLDGSVGFDDLVILARGYGKPGGWANGDFNGDGEVGFDDLVILARNYGKSGSAVEPVYGGDLSVSRLPEPFVFPLALISAGVLLRRTRIRRRS